ncbi:hypothetical protein ACAG24_010285 [Mycobacterium sp. pW049]|uniref:hypothetical protein n=1 Tax=[Mycobacterium] bulgaricum TaxID=3238985 RepID=UPI00351B0419
MTAPTPHSRPRVVDLAFWCFVVGAVVMIVGGLMASTAAFDAERLRIADADAFLAIVRGTGIGAVLVGGALAFLAGKARRGDARFHRAALALAVAAIVVIVIIAGWIGAVHLFILLSLLPLLIGVLLFVQPSARRWFQQQKDAT